MSINFFKLFFFIITCFRKILFCPSMFQHLAILKNITIFMFFEAFLKVSCVFKETKRLKLFQIMHLSQIKLQKNFDKSLCYYYGSLFIVNCPKIKRKKKLRQIRCKNSKKSKIFLQKHKIQYQQGFSKLPSFVNSNVKITYILQHTEDTFVC